MIGTIQPRTSPPPRNGGTVKVIAEGRVNPGQVSPDGNAVVFGEFKPNMGESVYRWEDGDVVKLNHDNYSSYQVRCNHDASVATFHRYSLKDASDETGNWDIARWENGKLEVVGGTEQDEMSPGIDSTGDVIVYDRDVPDKRKSTIERWKRGEVETLTNGEHVDMFAEVSGSGQRIVWRRDLDNIFLRDQNEVNKPIQTEGSDPAGLTLDHEGTKILYAAKDDDGDQNLYLTDTSTSQTIAISAVKGMEEYEGQISGDGSTVVFTGLDFRKERADMNVYVWRNGKTEQLTWGDDLSTKATVSDDGNAISWFSIDRDDTTKRKVFLWERDQKSN